MLKTSYFLDPVDTHDLPQRFLDSFAAILEHSNYGPALDAANRLLAKCGRCSVTCPIYQAGDLQRDNPCYRSELLLQVYRRYFTPGGAIRGSFGGGFQLTHEHVNEIAEEYFRCTACKRCRMDCPMGIDHAMITHVGRWVLSEAGVVPKALRAAVRAQLEGDAKNTSAIPAAAMTDTCEFLAEDCEDEHGVKVEFPFDKEGAEYLFFPAVSDFLLEPETLMGNAAVLGAAKVDWTIGTGYFDGINYGLFVSDRFHERIINQEFDELERLKVEKILVGECGHASRAAKHFVDSFWCDRPGKAPEVANCVDIAYRAFKSGEIELRENVIEGRVTYHDPCNIARSGWIVEQPRELLRHICQDYVEMTPRGTKNYCCGGGGGSVSIDELREFRTGLGGKTKADQIAATKANMVVAPCANCKKQLKEVCEDNGLGDVKIIGLHDLLLRALVPPDHMRAGGDDDGDEQARG
jgi:Fe-S oxidoreductase